MEVTPMASVPPNTGTDAEGLAKTREQFLTAQSVEPNRVRDTILASWWRSWRWNLAADRIDLSYMRDPDLDTPLTRSALPILRHLRQNLEGQAISIIVTDPGGVVLTRMTGDRALDTHLDSVKLAPGFSYAEQFVGTNGIGTALEGGRPMHVFGHEHYAENLEDLACAGVPLHHPISGKTIGAVDLTCWRRDAGPLLLTLAKTTADQIEQALLTDTGVRELELLHEYLRTCRRTPGIVFALNNDLVMMNELARQVLDPSEQLVLLGHAAEALASGNPSAAVVVDLPSGASARMYCRPVPGAGRRAGGVVHVKLIEPGSATHGHGHGVALSRMALPGLVGSGGLWLRGCHQVQASYRAGEWLALEGEPGVGKLAVLRAVHQRLDPARRFRVLDAADVDDPRSVADALGEPLDGSVVIRHVDRLGPAGLKTLSTAVASASAAVAPDADEHSSDGRSPKLWVAVTLRKRHDDEDLADLLRYFPSTVELPPLRHHVEDVQELVPFFLARLAPDGRLVCSPEAMQMLMRSSWPGNTDQLWQVLRRIVQYRRSGAIQPRDLPPECHTVSRRVLSPLESMERDAIVASLLASDGNKVKAAETLGMSRATIYRKIREYGIVAPTG
jgi:transcriptional regulator of acetoin/glycerol metabolism